MHAVASLSVIVAGWCFNVTKQEWCLLSLSIGLVWAAEALNTAIEFVVDLASPEHHDLAGKAKDVAAGSVLLAAIASAAVGMIVFGPYLIKLTAAMDEQIPQNLAKPIALLQDLTFVE